MISTLFTFKRKTANKSLSSIGSLSYLQRDFETDTFEICEALIQESLIRR